MTGVSTKAQDEVTRVLARLLAKGQPYRAGALLLSYRDEAGVTRIANGIGLQMGATLTDSAPEVACLLERLGALQAELMEVIEGKRSLPAPGLDMPRDP